MAYIVIAYIVMAIDEVDVVAAEVRVEDERPQHGLLCLPLHEAVRYVALERGGEEHGHAVLLACIKNKNTNGREPTGNVVPDCA